MNTSSIISTMSSSIIDRDSLNIVKSFVKSMEDYDEDILEATKPNFTCKIIEELNYMSQYFQNEEEDLIKLLEDPAIISVGNIVTNYSIIILDNIKEDKMLKQLVDDEMFEEQMWEEANGFLILDSFQWV